MLSSTDACPKCLSTSLFFSIASGCLLPSVCAEAILCQLCKTCISALFWFCPEKPFLSMPVPGLESHTIPPNNFYFALLFLPHSFARHRVVDKQSVLKNMTCKDRNSKQDKKGETTTFLCLVSIAMFSPQPAVFGCNIQTLLPEIQKMAQCIPFIAYSID